MDEVRLLRQENALLKAENAGLSAMAQELRQIIQNMIRNLEERDIRYGHRKEDSKA